MQAAALVSDPGQIYIDHPGAYAFALIEADGAVIDGRNLGLIPPDMLRPGPFATDWLAWPNGVGLLPVVATHNVADSAPPVSVVLFMAADPAELLGKEVWDEFRGHVWLPLLPIAALLIGGTLLTLRRALRPVAKAAAWARSIEPGRVVPPLDQTDAPAEIFDMTEAVRRSIARLDAELSAEQRRAAEAAHALRTPVAVLVARLDELPAGPAFDLVRRDVRALSRMVTQFLSSAGADRLEITDDQRADLNAVARRVVTELVPYADANGAEIDLFPAEGPLLVRGSGSAIGLALTNLIENAIIHAPGRIEVRVGPGPDIAVRDHGPGLPDGAGDLFEPFRRGKGAARGGAGPGLAIVARIQRAHGGTVTAGPAPGQGAIFQLGFPAA
ncbi:HAMP domain-containing sensor histidine kinase [Paracoccaceae bacterium Fryx2]|nr:HAMP domain-containing sensor histidine kinase [Paracoccaceae bacterium Fryx2]MDT8858367.1 HAMP domain-containing sensor histidine kinase [Paracoccaceae bacterium Fryx2]